MKRKILIYFYKIMFYFGVIHLFYFINRHKQYVLTYHNVIPDLLFDEQVHLGVSHKESVFNKHIQLVKKRLSAKHKCLITFDDGYKNQLEIAAKLLNKYGLQGIFFISFSSIQNARPLIIDNILMWFSFVPEGVYTLFNKTIEVKDNSRSDLVSDLYNQLLNNHHLWTVVEAELDSAFQFDILKINPVLIKLRFTPLTPDDLKLLIAQGHIVGAHSWNHFPLGTLPLSSQEEDFKLSAFYAQKYCNSKLYSYPFGGMSEVSKDTTKLCEKYGFSEAYMNTSQPCAWKGINRNYALTRQSLPNDDNPFLLEAKLSGFESFCKSIVGFFYGKRKLYRVAYQMV